MLRVYKRTWIFWRTNVWQWKCYEENLRFAFWRLHDNVLQLYITDLSIRDDKELYQQSRV